MKKQIYIIAILFLLLNTFFMSAQTLEEELKNNLWYVDKVILDDTEYIAPLNEERLNVGPDFAFDADHFQLFFCFQYYSNTLTFSENQQFTVSGWNSLLEPSACSIQENTDYDVHYYSSVMNVFATTGPFIFSYEVNSIDSSTKQLIITNQNGDKVYFYNYYLSNPPFELAGINIYPNPVSDVLQIDLPDSAQDSYVFKIYDITGKNVKVFKDKTGKQIALDIQDLDSGIYWLEINMRDALQRGYYSKIIKK